MKNQKSVPNAIESRHLTTADLCTRWSVSHMFIFRRCREGVLKSIKIGPKHVRFLLSDVLEYESKSKVKS